MKKMFKKEKGEPEKLTNADVGMSQDLLFGIKHLVGAENHCRVSAALAREKKDPDASEFFKRQEDQIRRIRTDMMKLVVKKNFYHAHCITKHLSGASMSCEECGSRFSQTQQDQEADFFYNSMAKLDLMIMGINDVEGDGTHPTSA